MEVKKDFIFEFVYNVVKHLPKFAVGPHSMSPQVAAGLALEVQQFIAMMSAKYRASEEPRIANPETSNSENATRAFGDSPFDLNRPIDISDDEASSGDDI